ncbi:MAG: hypothetical protein JJE22_00395 [Bacteroidia bacterium]|nr:hypothetical protein [Bacteroidia bacterium]
MMRITFLLLLIFPFIINAQINRSATEFAKEKVKEYITTKLFIDNSYKPVSYSELNSFIEKKSGIAWFIKHEFEITESHNDAGKKVFVQKPYRFTFYLNEKMEVVRAEYYYITEI